MSGVYQKEGVWTVSGSWLPMACLGGSVPGQRERFVWRGLPRGDVISHNTFARWSKVQGAWWERAPRAATTRERCPGRRRESGCEKVAPPLVMQKGHRSHLDPAKICLFPKHRSRARATDRL
jgi:hypothetical protein